MEGTGRSYAMENLKSSHDRTMKRISKPVEFEGEVYPSGAALARHLKFPEPRLISYYIKKGDYKGRPIKRVSR